LRKSSSFLGASYKILGINDGTVVPSVENRLKVLEEIRSFDADIVFTHRPNDYHPDHRYTSKLVEDTAYMVMVPLVLPSCPPLTKNPLFLYFNDPFTKPCKFQPDVVIDIDSVVDDRAYALNCHESQMWEWMPWIDRKEDEVKVLKSESERLDYLLGLYSEKTQDSPEKQQKIKSLYQKEPDVKTRFCESFEFCEYGVRVNSQNLKKYFPMIQ
jgi:LmbE family N-acetylglucosaminyl deacetylase